MDEIFHVYVDGATEGWNGPLGTVSHVGLGVFIPGINVRHSSRVPGISSNEAELKALIKAMELCLENEIYKAVFFSDSRIAVNRANGRHLRKKKNNNKRMHSFQKEIFVLKKHFAICGFVYIPRDLNQTADELSIKEIKTNRIY